MRLALLVLVVSACVVVIFLTPGIDLPRTALRAYRAAKQLVASVRAAAFARTSPALSLIPAAMRHADPECASSLPDHIASSCPLLC